MRASLGKIASGNPADPKLVFDPRIWSHWRPPSRAPLGALCHVPAADAVYEMGYRPFTSTPYALPPGEDPKEFCARMIGEVPSEEFPIVHIQCSDTGTRDNYTPRDVINLLGPCAVAVNSSDGQRVVVRFTCFFAG